jgi:hypothetical protein
VALIDGEGYSRARIGEDGRSVNEEKSGKKRAAQKGEGRIEIRSSLSHRE